MVPGDCRRRKTDRCSASANQQMFALCEAERFEQRSPGRLQHLRKRTECLPGELRLNLLNLVCWNAGAFGVAAIKDAPHTTHHGRNDIPLLKLSSGSLFDDA